MDQTEYLSLQASPDPNRNFHASVIFSVSGMVRKQYIGLEEFFAFMSCPSPEIFFDDQRCVITRLNFDLVKRTVKIHAEQLQQIQT